MSVRGAAPPAATRAFWVLGLAAWIILALGACSTFVLLGPSEGTPIRLAVVVTLAALWASGAATVSADQMTAVVTFPAPGEVLYLASYLGMAGFLLLDVRRRPVPPAAIWLEAVVVCGGAVCLAAFAILTPLSGSFARGGVQLLLAILYPLIDVILGVVVLAQMMLARRGHSRRTAMLVLGFAGLAVADSTFITSLAGGDYSSSLVLDAVWAVSFAAIVAGARMAPTVTEVRTIGRNNSGVLLLVAATLAVVVLVLNPGAGSGMAGTSSFPRSSPSPGPGPA
jgi:hypothetical protein